MTGHVDLAQTLRQGDDRRMSAGNSGDGEAVKGTKPLPPPPPPPRLRV